MILSKKLYGDKLTTVGYFNVDKAFQNLYNRVENGTGLYGYIEGYSVFWYPDYTKFGLVGNEDKATADEALKKWLSENKAYFTYVLAEPTETNISLPVVPTKKGNIFITTNTSLPASNISAKYSVKP